MQKYSHNSRRVQKELGGDVYALSGRVDSIEDDITRLEGYEEHVVNTITVDSSETIDTISKALSECGVWFNGPNLAKWDSVELKVTGSSLASKYRGTYHNDKNQAATKGDVLHKYVLSYYNGLFMSLTDKLLAADPSTGALSYTSTTVDTGINFTQLTLTFRKGVLS
jgi:hypothetical protein